MTYLALRKTPPSGLLQVLFAKLTMARLVTRYPHAGIVMGGTLYHATFAHGVHSIPFDSAGWDLFKIDIPQELLLNRFKSVKGARYDWFSLLAFVLPFRVSMGKWLYCYELAYLMMTGDIPIQRITPEDLLRIAYATHESTRNGTLDLVH
jgi:hypothetical protein